MLVSQKKKRHVSFAGGRLQKQELMKNIQAKMFVHSLPCWIQCPSTPQQFASFPASIFLQIPESVSMLPSRGSSIHFGDGQVQQIEAQHLFLCTCGFEATVGVGRLVQQQSCMIASINGTAFVPRFNPAFCHVLLDLGARCTSKFLTDTWLLPVHFHDLQILRWQKKAERECAKPVAQTTTNCTTEAFRVFLFDPFGCRATWV